MEQTAHVHVARKSKKFDVRRGFKNVNLEYLEI